MKKLIYVSTRLPWPTDSGRKVTLYNYCKGLHELFGFEVYLYSFLDSDQAFAKDDTPSFIKDVVLAKKVGGLTVLKNLLWALVRGRPLQEALFQSRENQKNLKSFLKSVSPDVVIVDMIRLAPYVSTIDEQSNALKVLDIDDLLSKRYLRQIAKGASRHALGTSAKGVSGASLLKASSLLSDIVLKREAKALERAEIEYSRMFDKVFFVSEKEARAFAEENHFDHVFSAGMGVDVDFYSEDVPIDRNSSDLSFVGNMAYGPNIESVEFIGNEILPLIKHDVCLKVVGPCDDVARATLGSLKRVQLLGRLDDLRGAVRATSLYVAPISYGSGIKTKILEAMAMGMCVLTNEVGAEGISARRGIDYFVEDDPRSMAVLIDELLDDPPRVQEVGNNARRYVDANCRWDHILQGFSALCGR